MKDIELVIKIPEEDYEMLHEMLKVLKEVPAYDLTSRAYVAIANGTPLPKGHGVLKDMGNLPYIFDLTRENPIYSGKDIEQAIKSMTTIIEADKEK